MIGRKHTAELDPPQPGGRFPVAPLEATNGTNDNRLSPVFPNPDSMSPGISQEARRYWLV